MEHKKHHYIPVCYLKRFAYEKNSIIHVYDKVSAKCFSKNIKDICYEDNFYRLSDEYISSQNNPLINPLSIELDYFAHSIEKDFDLVLDNIHKETKESFDTNYQEFKLTIKNKSVIAKFITIQYLRIPLIRNIVVAEEKRIEEKMIRLFKQGLAKETNNQKIIELPIVTNIDSVSCHAANTYLDYDYVNRITNHLTKSYWHFYYSPQGNFYSSDNPISIIHACNNTEEIDFGLTNYGVEISFPLNPWLLLTIYDYQYYDIYKESDGLLFEAVKEHIEHANVCRFSFSKRFVFSKIGDFTTAQKAQSIVANSPSKSFF